MPVARHLNHKLDRVAAILQPVAWPYAAADVMSLHALPKGVQL